MYKFGPVQQKLLLLLMGGFVLGMETSSIRYYRKLRLLRREWKKIDQRSFNRSVQRLSAQKLVKEVILPDGSFKLVLMREGVRQARIQYLFGRTIRFKNPKEWDKKWRIVLFDIPEDDRDFRDLLRNHLRELKFYKLQHSVFISPFPCEKQLLELVSLYKAEQYVRIMTASWVDNEEKIKKYFFKPAK
jgi:phenylacetic acid degradation operon negative regulatory protein